MNDFLIYALYGLAALAGIYLVFIVGPSITAFFITFGRKRGTSIYEMSDAEEYYAPFYREVFESYRQIEELPHTGVYMTARDGIKLYADYYDAGSDKTAILIHGYCAVPLTNFAVAGKYLFDRKYNLLMPHFRAHGKSGGKFMSMGLREQYDILDWTDYADKNLGAREIIIYGTSMGCTTVSYASDKIKNQKVRALILDCGFTSPYLQLRDDMIRRHLPYRLMMPLIRLMGKMILKEDIAKPVTESLKNAAAPCLFLHGTADQTVKFEQGKRNFESCGAEKQALFVENARHIMCFTAGGEQTRLAVWQFINKYSDNERKDI